MELINITYKQLRENNYLSGYNDKYGLAAFIDDNVRNTFLSNPNNNDDSNTAILFAVDNGDIVGRHLLYGTSLKCDNNVYDTQSSGSTEVHESQRGKGIGSNINKFTLNNTESTIYICSLLSPQCLSLMSKPENGCTIFNFPQMIKIVNTEAAFACRGINGLPLKCVKSIANLAVKIVNIPNKFKYRKLIKIYSIRKESAVPKWAGEMCLNDGHKYAEYHDTAWLQWNLTHNLSGNPEDIQSFFSIYKNDKPVAFFFTKQRLRTDIGKYKMLIGTVCEWASIDKNLTEADINLLATERFSKDCYYILTVTDSNETVKKIRKQGFISHGFMQMGFKDKLNQFPDMGDMNLWRIRYGCCNSILF